MVKYSFETFQNNYNKKKMDTVTLNIYIYMYIFNK